MPFRLTPEEASRLGPRARAAIEAAEAAAAQRVADAAAADETAHRAHVPPAGPTRAQAAEAARATRAAQAAAAQQAALESQRRAQAAADARWAAQAAKRAAATNAAPPAGPDAPAPARESLGPRSARRQVGVAGSGHNVTGGAPIGGAGRGPWRGGLRWAAGIMGAVVLGWGGFLFAVRFLPLPMSWFVPPQAPAAVAQAAAQTTAPSHAAYHAPAGTAPTNAPPYPASGTAPAYHAPQPVATVAPGPTAAEVACYARFGGTAVMNAQGIADCNQDPNTNALILHERLSTLVTTVTATGGAGQAHVTCVYPGFNEMPQCDVGFGWLVPDGSYVNLRTRSILRGAPAASCPPTLTGRRSAGLTNRGAMLLTLYLANPETGARVALSGWIDTGAMMTVVAHGEGPAVGLQPHLLSMGMQGVDGAPTASHTYTADLQTAAGYTVSRGAMDVSSASLPAAGFGLTPTTLLLGQSFLRNWTLVEAPTTWSLSPNWCTTTTTENVG